MRLMLTRQTRQLFQFSFGSGDIILKVRQKGFFLL